MSEHRGLSERSTADVIEAAQDVCRAVLAHEVSSVSRRTWPAVSDANNRLWQVLKSLGLDPLARSDEHTLRGRSGG